MSLFKLFRLRKRDIEGKATSLMSQTWREHKTFSLQLKLASFILTNLYRRIFLSFKEFYNNFQQEACIFNIKTTFLSNCKLWSKNYVAIEKVKKQFNVIQIFQQYEKSHIERSLDFKICVRIIKNLFSTVEYAF